MLNFPPLTADMVNEDWKSFLKDPPKHGSFGEYLIDKYLKDGQDCPRLRWADNIDLKNALTKHINRTQVIPVITASRVVQEVADDEIPF